MMRLVLELGGVHGGVLEWIHGRIHGRIPVRVHRSIKGYS